MQTKPLRKSKNLLQRLPAKTRRLQLANRLEKEIRKKPYDDYICIDKKILWQVIDELRK